MIAALKSYVFVAVPLPGGFGNVKLSLNRFTLPVGGCASNDTFADGAVGIGSNPDQSMWKMQPTWGSLPGPPLPMTLPSIFTVPLLPPAPAAPAVVLGKLITAEAMTRTPAPIRKRATG